MPHDPTGSSRVEVQRVTASAFRIPTEAPESDGTLCWDATTLVVVEAEAGGETGIGYSYAAAAAADLVERVLADVVRGRDALRVDAAWAAMRRQVRNLGRPGIASCAIAAVDVALWDLKARLLGQPLSVVLDAPHASVPAYGSGGFTSLSEAELEAQLAGFVEQGVRMVKMKVGREPAKDPRRVGVARRAVGPDVALFVDANGAYDRKQALGLAQAFAEEDVSWLEEPVSSDDVPGLRLLRDQGPPGMEIAAGEYGYDLFHFRRLLEAGAVDVLQADATRCGGISGFLRAAALCEAHNVPLSAHTAPTIHAHAGCAALPIRHVEWFFDHARIEAALFDGAVLPDPRDGCLHPGGRPGLGIAFKRADAERFRVRGAGSST